MDFIKPNLLWNLLWLLPLLIILALIYRAKRKKILISLIGDRKSEEYTDLSPLKRTVRYVLLCLCAVFALVAASRPFWGYELLPFGSYSRDVLIIVDISKSMLAKDIPPSRLDHAKMFMKELVSSSKNDRFGIIVFAGTAFLECPLTEDKGTLYKIINSLDPSSIPVGGTNIERALKTAMKAFSAAKGSYKAIVLISDGEELQGESANVIDQLKALKVPILIAGIGDPEIPSLIQYKDQTGADVFLKDSKGEPVRTRLDESNLIKLAQMTNGLYVRSTSVNSGVTQFEDRINQLIPEKYLSSSKNRPLERFQIPLLFSLICLIAALLLSERRKKS